MQRFCKKGGRKRRVRSGTADGAAESAEVSVVLRIARFGVELQASGALRKAAEELQHAPVDIGAVDLQAASFREAQRQQRVGNRIGLKTLRSDRVEQFCAGREVEAGPGYQHPPHAR